MMEYEVLKALQGKWSQKYDFSIIAIKNLSIGLPHVC